MRIIAIANNKGGVGKTTSAQNIGAAISVFSRVPLKVLMIDLDPQESLTKSFGIRLEEGGFTSGSFMLQKATLEQACIKYKDSHIDILPASSSLLDDEKEIQASKDFPFNLKKALERDPKKYDYVVIDCPPALSALTRVALIACDRYYIPLQPEFLSYEGLRKFIHYTNDITQVNPEVELGGVFATRFNPKSNKKFSNELIESVGEQLGDRLLKAYIRENGDLYKAQAQGKHIFDYNQSSNGALDYYDLTKEIITKT